MGEAKHAGEGDIYENAMYERIECGENLGEEMCGRTCWGVIKLQFREFCLAFFLYLLKLYPAPFFVISFFVVSTLVEFLREFLMMDDDYERGALEDIPKG